MDINIALLNALLSSETLLWLVFLKSQKTTK